MTHRALPLLLATLALAVPARTYAADGGTVDGGALDGGTAPPPESTLPLVIGTGHGWRYDDTGTDHGNAWLSAEFDDGGWASGPSPLGYGDGDETTVLSSSPVHPSYYFRTTITLDEEVSRAELAVNFDDGFAVFINSARVMKRNVALGLHHERLASREAGDNQLALLDLTLTASPFKIGPNVIAVLVKQYALTSSDVSFDLRLYAEGGRWQGASGGLASYPEPIELVEPTPFEPIPSADAGEPVQPTKRSGDSGGCAIGGTPGGGGVWWGFSIAILGAAWLRLHRRLASWGPRSAVTPFDALLGVEGDSPHFGDGLVDLGGRRAGGDFRGSRAAGPHADP